MELLAPEALLVDVCSTDVVLCENAPEEFVALGLPVMLTTGDVAVVDGNGAVVIGAIGVTTDVVLELDPELLPAPLPEVLDTAVVLFPAPDPPVEVEWVL